MNHDNEQREMNSVENICKYFQIQQVVLTCWWLPATVQFDLRPIQQERNCDLYWKSSWLPSASDAMDLRKECTITIFPDQYFSLLSSISFLYCSFYYFSSSFSFLLSFPSSLPHPSFPFAITPVREMAKLFRCLRFHCEDQGLELTSSPGISNTPVNSSSKGSKVSSGFCECMCIRAHTYTHKKNQSFFKSQWGHLNAF